MPFTVVNKNDGSFFSTLCTFFLHLSHSNNYIYLFLFIPYHGHGSYIHIPFTFTRKCNILIILVSGPGNTLTLVRSKNNLCINVTPFVITKNPLTGINIYFKNFNIYLRNVFKLY